MENVIVIRYGEIFLKGKNRSYFESLLVKNIKEAICRLEKELHTDVSYKFGRSQGRYVVEGYKPELENDILQAVSRVFGIHSVSLAKKVETAYDRDFLYIRECLEAIAKRVKAENTLSDPTLRVTVKRADKSIPLKSFEIAQKLAGNVLKHTGFKVDLNNADYEFFVDIRENGYTYVYDRVIMCHGGLPVGCSNRGLLLLSGGIDSPVAAYMMAKRGMKLSAVHFASPPYTSERAKQKVVQLRDAVSKYTTDMKLYVVPFTDIQLEIHKNCPSEFMITIMRRFMMRIATKLANRLECAAIVTGESLGQVASQTVESMTSTESCAGLPVFRPLIAFDKEETMELAKRIGTYDISIEPYEDCCTVFLPKKPAIKPKLDKVAAAEAALDIDALVAKAMENIEVL